MSLGDDTPGAEPGDRDQALRRSLVSCCRELPRRGLVVGTAGNVSVRRDARHFFVSPTGADYRRLEPADVPLVDLDGTWYGGRRPSSEWRMHRDLLRARPEIGCVVHTHSREATALACTGRGIPAFHYMVAVAGGSDIVCAEYHTFGTQALSDAALAALAGRRACLLAQHGVVCLGADPDEALALAVEVEDLAAKYRLALGLGGVRLLDEGEMQRVLERFRTYGRADDPDADLAHGGEGLPGWAADPTGTRR